MCVKRRTKETTDEAELSHWRRPLVAIFCNNVLLSQPPTSRESNFLLVVRWMQFSVLSLPFLRFSWKLNFLPGVADWSRQTSARCSSFTQLNADRQLHRHCSCFQSCERSFPATADDELNLIGWFRVNPAAETSSSLFQLWLFPLLQIVLPWVDKDTTGVISPLLLSRLIKINSD